MYNSFVRTFARRHTQILSNFQPQTRSKTYQAIFSNSIRTLGINSASREEKVRGALQHLPKAGASAVKSKSYHSTNNFWNPFSEKVTDRDRILAVCGNISCSDCSSSDVQYVSTINGGVYCPVCAGIHREIGTHPDFITLQTDIKVSNEDMQFYESMGNSYINNIYEASLDVIGADKPTVSSTRDEISKYIRKKYFECSFSVSRHDRPATENVLHYVSNMKARGRDVPNLREKVVERAGSTYAEIMDEAFDSPYVLHVAE